MKDKNSQRKLLPRKILFGNPDKCGVNLSPDGSKIGYLAPLNGVLNVWISNVDDIKNAKPVTNDTKRGIRWYFWAHTNSHIVYMQDKNGDENWRLYSVNLGNNEIKDLTPFEKTQARVCATNYRFPDTMLVSLNNRDETWHDLYSLNIITGELKLVFRNEGYSSFIIDNGLKLRGLSKTTPDGSEIFKVDADGGISIWDKIPSEDELTTNLMDFDKTDKTIFMNDSRGRNTSALFSCEFRTKEKILLASNEKSDTGNVMKHPTEKNLQAVSFIYERKKWKFFDTGVRDEFKYLKTVSPGDPEVWSRTLDDSVWIVSYIRDDGPTKYYLFRRKERKMKFLFTDRKELEDLSLAAMHPAVIKSRDKLALVSYYSLPPGTDLKREGIPDRPLPMVLVPHGGPWGRDHWGFNPLHQWLCDRGYAVLSVNFRASTGFGKSFVNAGDLEWGGKVIEDQIDAVNWAIRKKIADPGRIAVMGGSFGGYSTLAGLTFHPDVFACGVDIVGPSNLITLLETIPPYWKPVMEIFRKRVGDPATDAGRKLLSKHSPLNYIGNIKKPLLIGQGANDPRVKQSESDQIANAMMKKKLPVTYVLYPDEGHGFARPENNMSFFAVAEAFLAKYLGGRCQPVGDDFKGASIKIIAGAEHVPGLK